MEIIRHGMTRSTRARLGLTSTAVGWTLLVIASIFFGSTARAERYQFTLLTPEDPRYELLAVDLNNYG